MPYWGMTQYVVHGWHVSYPRCSTTTVPRPSCRFAVERYIEHPRFLMFGHFRTLRFLMFLFQNVAGRSGSSYGPRSHTKGRNWNTSQASDAGETKHSRSPRVQWRIRQTRRWVLRHRIRVQRKIAVLEERVAWGFN